MFKYITQLFNNKPITIKECDHIFKIYSNNPLRSACVLCKKEHPLSGKLS